MISIEKALRLALNASPLAEVSMPKPSTNRGTQDPHKEGAPPRPALPLGLRAMPVPGGVQFDARWAIFPAVFRNIPWVFIIAVIALLFFRSSLPSSLFNQLFIVIMIISLLSPFALLRYARLSINEKELVVKTRTSPLPLWKQRRFLRADIREIVCMVRPGADDFSGWELRIQTKAGEQVLLKSPQPAPHLRYIEFVLREILASPSKQSRS
jgi:hypothetical protein